jgi:hypothetical protein
MRIEQALDQRRRHPRLARAGGHLDQQLAPPLPHRPAQALDAGALVAASGHPGVDGDRGRRHAQVPDGDPPLQRVLAEDRGHRAEMRILVEVAKADLLAVGQEHEGQLERRGIAERLRLGSSQAYARPLRLQHGERLPAPIAEHVIGLAAVAQAVLEPDAPPVGKSPARVLELPVDPGAREGFVGHGRDAI